MNSSFKFLNDKIITIVLLQISPSRKRGTWLFHLVKVPVTRTVFPPNPHLKLVITKSICENNIPVPGLLVVVVGFLMESDYLNKCKEDIELIKSTVASKLFEFNLSCEALVPIIYIIKNIHHESVTPKTNIINDNILA